MAMMKMKPVDEQLKNPATSRGYEFAGVHPGHDTGIEQIEWSNDGTIIAAFSENKVTYWDTKSGGTIPQSDQRIDPFAWPDRCKLEDVGPEYGEQVVYFSDDRMFKAFGLTDGSIVVVDARSGTKPFRIFRGHTGKTLWIAWSKDKQTIASGSEDRTVGIWSVRTGRLLQILEGHANSVVALGWSSDEKLLASKSLDGTVRIWRTDTWQATATVRLQGSVSFLSGLAFHPKLPLLAVGDDHDTVIHIYKLYTRILLNKDELSPWTQYTNAKVVLVGDSAVGKSGLGLVLTKHPFAATESTHGRHVYTFDAADFQMGKDRREMRETLLWDLAGQPGYRLIHQLHLREVTVALICFDGRSETDPFSGVRHWTRALNQAQNMIGTSALPLRKFLVSARNDRGGISVSKERMETFVAEMGFDGYFETSAKEGWNIQELSTAIREAIDWEALPRVNSNALFQDIKEFLLTEKEEGHLLSTKQDLYRRFIKSDANIDASDDLEQQFDTCIGRVESRDLIRRLGFGNLVLLQPEMLDSYASAMVDAAKSEPD